MSALEARTWPIASSSRAVAVARLTWLARTGPHLLGGAGGGLSGGTGNSAYLPYAFSGGAGGNQDGTSGSGLLGIGGNAVASSSTVFNGVGGSGGGGGYMAGLAARLEPVVAAGAASARQERSSLAARMRATVGWC